MKLRNSNIVCILVLSFCVVASRVGVPLAFAEGEGHSPATENETIASSEDSSFESDDYDEEFSGDEDLDSSQGDAVSRSDMSSSSEEDGSTGRVSGELDPRIPERQAKLWEGNSPLRGAGRHAGSVVAGIAVGNEALPVRNIDGHADFVSKVSEIIQWGVLDGGCEIVSMTSVLNAMGYNITPQQLADNYVAYDEAGTGDFVNYYIGSPYESGGGFPPTLAYAGNAFLDERGSDWRFRNATGAEYKSLLTMVDYGLPVLVWTTMYQDNPLWTDLDQDGYRWYDNEHCVVLYGHDDEEGTVQVMDPMVGLVDYDANRFEEIYNECGKLALILSFG